VRPILLATLIVCSMLATASADVRIRASKGGQIGEFLQMFMTVRESGERVVIDGPCFSACTLVLGVVPKERICVTPRAVLGFHAAWMPTERGRTVTQPVATRLMMDLYPSEVRSFIKRRGGLNSHLILLRGRELAALYPRCI
jgi:hypothetical protein